MRRMLLCVLVSAALFGAVPKKPKLVLFVVIDQCRYDYLTRFRSDYHGGLDRLLKHGASFANDNNDFYPTLTAVSHATLLSGAMPAVHGIVANDWWDREAGKHVTSVSDSSTQSVGSAEEGASPRRLLAPTVGDELKKATSGSRIIGISIKDRSAILLTGQKAEGAYWFDDKTGLFGTSTYYRQDLPAWVRSFNDARPSDHYLGATWLDHLIPKDGKPLFKAVTGSPFGNVLTEELAERALAAENLGKRADTDLLAVSFSSVDYVGHNYGSDSPEVHEALVGMDRVLDKLLKAVDRQVGLADTLVVLTSDHGIPSLAEGKRAGIQGGREPLTVIHDAVQTALAKKYGPGKWVAGNWDEEVFLNDALIAEKKLNAAELRRAAAEALLKTPHIARTYTRDQLLDSSRALDETDRLVKNGFHPARGADVYYLTEPYWVFSELFTSHGSTYSYDRHIPLIFMGSGIRAGSIEGAVRSNDIAPTVAAILRIPAPGASVGRVLTEMFAQ